MIRRELRIAEGELFNATNLERSRQRVMALGYFEAVAIATHRGSSDDMIDVELEVRERSTGSFQVGAGFSSTESFLVQGQVAMDNLLGRGQALDGRGVPLTERYLLGGISDLRGYQPRSLGPHLWSQHAGDVGQPLDPLAIGGNLQLVGNAELEFPLVKSAGLSGVVFFDIGNAYNLESRFCIRPGSDACTTGFDAVAGLRKSVGLGVRWLSPLGPLRLEWGVPLDLKPGEKPDGLLFSIGTSF